jgi:hypothetical protein
MMKVVTLDLIPALCSPYSKYSLPKSLFDLLAIFHFSAEHLCQSD